MEFNLDFLEKTGKALKDIDLRVKPDFSNTDSEDEKSSIEKLDDFNKEKDIFSATQSEESKAMESMDDTGATESTKDVLIKEEKEKKEDTEDDLEKKLKSIEKVIETFSGSGGVTAIKNNSQLPAAVNLNQRPLDMGNTQAKAYQAEYLKPSNVQDERIALLYNDLKKYNLI